MVETQASVQLGKEKRLKVKQQVANNSRSGERADPPDDNDLQQSSKFQETEDFPFHDKHTQDCFPVNPEEGDEQHITDETLKGH